MRTTTLNKRITLQKRQSGQGHTRADTVMSEAEVYAAVRVPSLSFHSTMAASGLDTALTVVLWRSDFNKAAYTHAVVDGTAYRISSVGSGVNDLFVSLALERN